MMKWGKIIFGLMTFILAITCPDKVVALFLSALGAPNLINTFVGKFLTFLVCGSAFSTGLSWLGSGLKSIFKGLIGGEKNED